MSLSSLRHCTRRIPPPFSQRRLLPLRTPRPFSTSLIPQAQTQAEIDRACGVPEKSTEAGPREPGGILKPEFWIVALAAIASATAFYFFVPSSSSKSGQAMQKKILGERKALEHREGVEGEDETAGERELEAGLIKDAAEKKMKGATAEK